MVFTCRTCGQQHDAGDISFGAEAPVQWNLLSDSERSESLLGGEQCVIEKGSDRHFFVRACLEVPIQGTDRTFTWGVWVSLSETNFAEMAEHWLDEARTKLGPYFGWLCTVIPEYPDTVFLKTMVHQRPVGQRPNVVLEVSDHPLSVDQRSGIDPERMLEIVSRVLHN